MKSIAFFVALIVLGLSPVVSADEKVGHLDAAARCREEVELACQGACKDGWGASCYYDAAKVRLETNRSLDSQKEKCYGYYDSSVCTPCRNIHEIEGKSVSCEEFYEMLNKKNEECGGCLRSSFNGGG